MDNKATISSNMYKCINKITGFEFSFDKTQGTSKIVTDNKDTELEAIEKIMSMPEIDKVEIQGATYNIKSLSNLELRNAILYDYIPKVSFLLSDIIIKAGEDIDLGEKGIYKVRSGDTLSTIAQRNGMITKDLLILNPHLIEMKEELNLNKIKF